MLPSLCCSRGPCWLQTVMKTHKVDEGPARRAWQQIEPCVFSIHWGKLDTGWDPFFAKCNIVLLLYAG